MNDNLIHDKIKRIQDIEFLVSCYKDALINYDNYIKSNATLVYIIAHPSKFECKIDKEYVEKSLLSKIERTFSELKKLEVL